MIANGIMESVGRYTDRYKRGILGEFDIMKN
jgi:hypothetical protein